jgi:Tfp pilus assembly protein FimT
MKNDLSAEAGRKGGYSMVELLAVGCVVAVTAAIGVSSYARRSEAMCVQSAATSIVSHLRDARAAAISRNTNIEMTFLDREGQIILRGDFNKDGAVGEGETKVCRIADAGSVHLTHPPSGGTFTTVGKFRSADRLWMIRVDSPKAKTKYVYVYGSGQVLQADAPITL